MSEHQQHDPVAAAQALTAELAGMRAELAEANERAKRAEETAAASKQESAATRKRERRTRHIAVGLVISLVVDAVITGFLVNNNIQLGDVQASSAHNSATVSQLHAASVSACQQANVSRTQQAEPWDYVLGLLTPGKTETAAQRARVQRIAAALRKHVETAYAPRDCQALYRLSP